MSVDRLVSLLKSRFERHCSALNEAHRAWVRSSLRWRQLIGLANRQLEVVGDDYLRLMSCREHAEAAYQELLEAGYDREVHGPLRS